MTFDRILVGYDGSEAADAALCQAMRLREPDGSLTAVTVCLESLAAFTGPGVGRAARELHDQAEAAHLRALELLAGAPGTNALLVRGRALQALASLVKKTDASLVAVGWGGHGRPAGIAFGSIPTVLVHESPASVLVARTCPEPEAFPRRIVVGVDGSDTSTPALLAAEAIARRLDAEIDIVAAPESPVDALVEAAADAGLLVVGSRHLHGLKALGSVSERVAHRAPCSVLVAR